MERIFPVKKVYQVVFVGLFMATWAGTQAWAGTVMLAPPPSKVLDVREEAFPESRFGQPPMRVQTGVERGYAAREVEAWDEVGQPDEGLGRSPASHPVARQPVSAPVSAGEVRMAPPAVPGELNQAIASKKGVQEIAVIAGDLGFFPKTFFVTRDIPVRMFVTGASRNTLCIMMDSFQVRKQIRSQKIEEITFVPSQPGQYRFYCPVNGMEGTMIVKDLVSNFSQQ